MFHPVPSRFRNLASILTGIAVGNGCLHAEISVPPVFSNGMVLQSGLPVPVWGSADPGEIISVSFADQTKETTADANGRWRVTLDPLAVSAIPAELKIGTHSLSDVLVGEVWLCAGQSNMQWLVGKSGDYPGVEGGEQEIAGPGLPEIRLFSDPKEPAWRERGWRHARGEDLREFSATAWFFGKSLHRELGVPIGLINVSRGGSSIQSWTPTDFNARNPFTRHYSGLFRAHRTEIDAYNKANEAAHLARQAGRRDVQSPPRLDPEIAIANRFSGSALFDELIEPLAPFAVKGVVWYQGESNADFPETSRVYDSMLRDLIEGWRCRWDRGRMPWYVVQLPCWNSPAAAQWPWIRQGQLTVSRDLAEVHLVTTCDIGDGTDLHPPQKREVGERLAAMVVAHEYRGEAPPMGPVTASARREGSAVRLVFDSGSPIRAKKNAWKDVELAGEDGVFHPAMAEIGGDRALLTADAVASPTAVRYGWAGSFQPSLFNEAGLPASPFALALVPDGTFRFVSSGESPMTPLEGDRWCAIGDSITHAGGYLNLVYLYCATRFPNNRFDLFNCGAGGDTASGTVTRRMESDVLVHRPTLSTLMLGINDVWWEHSGLIAPGDYVRDMSRILDRLHAQDSGVLLLTPSPYDATVRSAEPLDPKRAGLEQYVGQLRRLAAERAIPLVDFHQVMTDITVRQQSKDPAFTLSSPDRIHPSSTGEFVMAHTLLRAMRAPALVSRVCIDAGQMKPQWVENAELSELSGDRSGISFNLIEKALPFPASRITAESLPLVDFAGDLNQQVFQVTALKKGRYELAIGNVTVGIFSSETLEKGVNLATMPDTPQNRQAAEVSLLIDQRRRIVSGKLRHIAMIEYGELKKTYAVGDAVSPAQDLEGTGRSYPEYLAIKPRQAELIEEAGKLDDQIWKANKPVKREWRLTLK